MAGSILAAPSRREVDTMPFINTEGLTIIGDGSQWFWSMASFLALPITGYVIYSQLRIARSASAREQMVAWDREWDSERQMRYRHEILVALRDGAERAHLPDGSATGIAVWWERVAQLARSGDQDLKALTSRYGRLCQLWWATLGPHLLRLRSEVNPRLFGNFEWLAEHIAEMDRRAGQPALDEQVIDPLDKAIASLEGSLRVEEALRTVIVASQEVEPAGQPRRRSPTATAPS
jgi:hypothetical protein